MKNITFLVIGALFAVLGAPAFATTYVPVGSLNPAGSISGQVIASTGSNTAPVWATITLSGLGGTVPIANGGTGATSAAVALTNLGALSTVTAASTYGAKASPLSQFSATTSAQLAGVMSDESGTGPLLFGTSPTITTPNIVGVTNGTAAAAGSVGELLTGSTGSTSLTNGTAANAASKLLTAGDWDVQCVAQFSPAGTTVPSLYTTGVSTTSATRPGFANESVLQATMPAGAGSQLASPRVPINVATSTTAYCVVLSSFTTSTMTVQGFILARRIR